jgi:hypothetical protein
MEATRTCLSLADVRQIARRATVCPHCQCPLVRDVRLIRGQLRRTIQCARQESCGWLLVVGKPLKVVEAE